MEKAIARFFGLSYAIVNKRVDGSEARSGRLWTNRGFSHLSPLVGREDSGRHQNRNRGEIRLEEGVALKIR